MQKNTNHIDTISREIHFDAPNVGNLEKKYLSKAIDNGFVSTFGLFVSEFEKAFANYIGVEDAVSLQSGTGAIHISLYELGIGKGDEVIVPALTFVATVNPIKYVGAEPVFVDVDIDTWNINTKEIENNITERTKAIIPVHLYGNPCNMDGIMRIAKKYNLSVIEDATESLSAKYNGFHSGTFGDIGCFSFNGNKMITTGGGGMVVSKNKRVLEHIRFIVNQARDESRVYFHPEIGFNYRMTNIEASLGLAQMDRIKEFVSKKTIFNAIYKEELRGCDSIQFQDVYPNTESSFWLTCVLINKEINIEDMQDVLSKKEIPTRRVFMPVVEFPPYRKNKLKEYSNSYFIHKKALCLPSSTLNSKDDVLRVCREIKKLI